MLEVSDAALTAKQENLRRLLAPQSIALIGGGMLEITIENLRDAGFAGRIHVVNPSKTEIAGIPCVASVADLPEAPDAAFVAVNRRLTVKAVEALAELGAGGAVCFAAGFGEMGEDGQGLESDLARLAGDLAIVGPNSNGLINRLEGLTLWPLRKQSPPLESGIAIIAQSGGIASMMQTDRRGLQPAIIASTGNQTVLDPADWLAVLSRDERITSVGMFLEGPGDIPALSQAAEAALRRKLPVVVLKSGRSALGAEMAATHTGAMAGEDELFDAFCARTGLLRVRSLPEFCETLKVLDILGQIDGRRVGVVTVSGAARALFADAAMAAGLELPPVSEGTAGALREILPEFAVVSNPLDHNAAYTGQTGLTLENEPALKDCFRTMLGDAYDIALLHDDWIASGEASSPSTRAWFAAAAETGTKAAIVSLMPENMEAATVAFCRQNGQPGLQGLDDAISAIAAAIRHGERVAEIGSSSIALPPGIHIPQGRRLVDEWAAKVRLEKAGVPFPARRRAAPGQSASIAEELGRKIVLKAITAKLPHKAKAGAVALGLEGAEAVGAAEHAIAERLLAQEIEPDGYLVEEMVEDVAAEIILGIRTSQVYGMALLIGAGGVDVESLDDSALILLPALPGEIMRALQGLRIAGSCPAEGLAAVGKIAEALAGFAVSERDGLASVELNPVLVTADGRAVAVDALIEEAVDG